jgi:predicted DNA-binding transcriptional regulator AlpA
MDNDAQEAEGRAIFAQFNEISANPRDSFLRVRDVARLAGISQSTVYRFCKTDPSFPRPLRLGARMNVWSKNAVHGWIEAYAKSCAGSGRKG